MLKGEAIGTFIIFIRSDVVTEVKNTSKIEQDSSICRINLSIVKQIVSPFQRSDNEGNYKVLPKHCDANILSELLSQCLSASTSRVNPD